MLPLGVDELISCFCYFLLQLADVFVGVPSVVISAVLV